MSLVFSSIAPIFLLVLLGAVLKAKAGFSDNFWQMVEKLTFNGLFPALLFVKIAESTVDWSTALPIAGVTIAGILLTTVATIPFHSLLKLTPEKVCRLVSRGLSTEFLCGDRAAVGGFWQ